MVNVERVGSYLGQMCVTDVCAFLIRPQSGNRTFYSAERKQNSRVAGFYSFL